MLPLSDRLANALAAYGWYLSSSFSPLHLGILYLHPRGDWSLLAVLAGAAVLLSLTLLCRWQARRRPWLLVGWLWFVGVLLPVIGLAQGGRQAWADRFSYFPHIGLFVALVWAAAEVAGRLRLRGSTYAAAVTVVLGCLVMLTQKHVRHWHSSLTLWQHALAVTRDNDIAHEHVAAAYLRLGRRPEAELHLTAAARIQYARMKKLLAAASRPKNRRGASVQGMLPHPKN